jgi:hypothetical protein
MDPRQCLAIVPRALQLAISSFRKASAARTGVTAMARSKITSDLGQQREPGVCKLKLTSGPK